MYIEFSLRALSRFRSKSLNFLRPFTLLHLDKQASVILEFAYVAPVFLFLLFSILSAGLSNLYQLALDDALRYAARQVQIAGPASTGPSNFVAAVCAQFGIIATNCNTALTYNIQTNASSTASFAGLVPVSMPTNGNLPNKFPAALPANNNVLLQVAFPLPFAFPFVGSALTLTGTNSIVSTATVRMEPYQ